MSENHYKTLGVPATSELESIKQAYRQQIRQYHPDIFAARRNEIMQLGDAVRLRAIEKEIEQAKQMTQRINAAYAILSDAEARARYDQQLAKERQVQNEAENYRRRMRNSDDGRRTVKSRPHRPPKSKSENAPVLLGFAFFIFLFIGSAFLTNTVFRQEETVPVSHSNNPTRVGEISMNDLQATTNSRNATRIARATIVALPSLTPRLPEDNERLGDSMMGLGQYNLAIEAYSDALATGESSSLYTKRGLAYSASYFRGQINHASLAYEDFNQALVLDAENALAYRGRGWLYYTSWQHGKSPLDAQAARSDFLAYLELVNTDIEIEAALLELGS